MKNTNAVSKFINGDIEQAKRELKAKLSKQVDTFKTIPTKATELGKKYRTLRAELESIEKEVGDMGCRVDTYGTDCGKIFLCKPNFYYYGRQPEVIGTENVGDYTEEIKAIVKAYNSKIEKLESLKRSFGIKLLGGVEVEKVLLELAKKLAEIIA